MSSHVQAEEQMEATEEEVKVFENTINETLGFVMKRKLTVIQGLLLNALMKVRQLKA